MLAEGGARICAADRGKQRRANAMSGDVGEGHKNATIGKGLPVIVIAAGLVGRLVPCGDVETGDLRH